MNTYKVPKKQWNRWSKQARTVFNTLYNAMTADPQLFWHPMAEKITPKLWKTTAWNASWIAADATDGVKE